MNNFDHAVEATTTAINSQGSALKENGRYMESLEAKTTALKSTFEDLANNIIDNELVGLILDLGNGFLQLANTDLGQIITQITLLSGLGWGATSLLSASGFIEAIGQSFSAFINIAKNGTKVITSFKYAMSGLLPVILGVSTVIALAAKGISAYNNYIEKNKTDALVSKIKELNTSIDDTSKSLEEVTKRLKELNEVPLEERTQAWIDERAELEYTIQKYEYLLQLQENERKAAARKITTRGTVESGGVKVVGSVTSQAEVEEKGRGWLLESGKSIVSDEQFEAVNKKYSTTTEAIYKLAAAFNIQAQEGLSAAEEIEYLQEALEEYGVFVTQETVATNEYVEAQKQQGETILSQIPYYRSLSEVQKESIQQWVEQNAEYAEAIRVSDAVSDEQRELLSIYNSVTAGLYKVSNATVAVIDAEEVEIDTTADLSSRVKEVANDLIALSDTADETSDSFLDLVAQEIIFNNTDLNVQQKIEALKQLALQAGVAADAISGATYSSSIDQNLIKQYMAEGLTKKEAFDKAAQQAAGGSLYSYWADLSALPKDDSTTSSSSGRTTGTATDAKLESLKKIVTLRKSELALLEAQDAPIEQQIAKQKEIQDALHEEAEYLREIGAEQSEVNDLSTEWWEIQNDINDALETALDLTNSIMQTLFNQQMDSIDQQIDEIDEKIDEINEKYDAQIEALEKENEQLERQIGLEEKLQALAEAKNKKVYVFKDGQFQYMEDAEAISSAQADLDAYNRELLLEQQKDAIEEQRDNELKYYEDQKKALLRQKAQWQEYSDSWDRLVENYELSEQALQLAQYQGVIAENSIWQERISNLQSFVGQYNDILGGLGTTTSGLSGLLSGDTSSGLSTFSGASEISAPVPTDDEAAKKLGYDSLADWYWAERMQGDVYQISDVANVHKDPELQKSVYEHFGGETWEDVDYAQKIIEAAQSDKYDTADVMYWAKKRQDKIASLGIEDEVESTRDIVEKALNGQHYQLFASGTTSASGGLSLVGEQGPELRVLNSGDGVIPADITRNLWDWGKMNPNSVMSSTSSQVFNIDNITLPNARDAESLVSGLKQMAYQRAYKRA